MLDLAEKELMLGLAEQKLADVGPRTEKVSWCWLSQIKIQLIWGLAEKTLAYIDSRKKNIPYLGSRTETNSLFQVSQKKNCLLLDVADKKSAL